MLFERKWAGGHLYVCEGGPLGTIGLQVSWTSLGTSPGDRPLNAEVLAELVALIKALKTG